MVRRLGSVLILLNLAFIAGCFGGGGPKPKDQKPTFPVTGIVQIDGKPTQGVQLFLFSAEDLPGDVITPTNSPTPSVLSGADGSFTFSTYAAGDGLPEGNYVISFYWDGGAPLDLYTLQDKERKLSPVATKFNRKYGVPAKSTFKFTVGKEPVDLKTLELATK